MPSSTTKEQLLSSASIIEKAIRRQKATNSKKVYKYLDIKPNTKIFLYAPTFRKDKNEKRAFMKKMFNRLNSDFPEYSDVFMNLKNGLEF